MIDLQGARGSLLRVAGLAAIAAVTAGAAGAAPCPALAPDLLASSDAHAAPLRPPHCATTTQTPPDFTWPVVADATQYTLALKHPDGRVERAVTDFNGLAWDRELPPGDYAWTVSAAGRTSGERRFTIAPGAVAFVLPPAEKIVAHARSRPHPRTFPDDATNPLPALKAERARGFRQLVAEVEAKSGTPVQPEPVSESVNANYDDTVAEHKRTLAAALAWAVTKRREHGRDAARRLAAQAQWSPTGPTSFATNDMGSRTIAWTLALGYDWAHDALTPAEREAILDAIVARTRDMVEATLRNGSILRHPIDSHGNLTLGITAAIAALIAGDRPEADEWLREAIVPAVLWTSPWGGADGGFANGTMQGQWDLGSNLLAWYVLRGAAGVDLSRKEWVRNHARYLAYFSPPGAPFGLFGDGQEMDPTEFRARVAKALALFAPTPIGAWHASRLRGEGEDRIELLLAPRRARAQAPGGQGFPDAAFFPSIGWVAMHSDLADPKRTSVYFRSSPYGAHNHGHADQNGFVIDHAGERLAIKSGYYDGYRTPHWSEWYKATRSANAITFDGGQGQGPDGIEFKGEVVRFESDGRVDRAVGRAEAAYGGALTRAEREIAYLRPGLVVVRDALASEAPRRWEWNLHALERMDPRPDGRVAVRRGRAAMCVEMLAGPETQFTQDDQFTAEPQGGQPRQWHGRFAAREPSAQAEFVALMRIGSGCGTDDAKARARRHADGTWEVNVGEATVRLGGATDPGDRGSPGAR